MNWYPHLYTGKTVEKKKKKLIRQIDGEIYRGNTYLITLAANPENMLELFSVQELRFPYHRKNCPLIVGLASGREEALEVVTRIVEDVWQTTGGTDVRAFFGNYDEI